MHILHSVLNMFSAPLFYSWNLTVQFIGDNARGNWMLVNLGLKRKERNSGPMIECYCLSWVMYSRKYLAPCHDIQTSLLLVCASQPWSREFPVYSSSSSKPLTPGVTSFYFLLTISPPSHENKGNDHQLKKLLIVEQILLISIWETFREQYGEYAYWY